MGLVAPQLMESWIRNRTCVPCIGRQIPYPLCHQGSPELHLCYGSLIILFSCFKVTFGLFLPQDVELLEGNKSLLSLPPLVPQVQREIYRYSKMFVN